MNRLLIIVLLSGLISSFFPLRTSQACVDDYAAWGWIQSWQSMDDEMVTLFCTDQSTLNSYWNALNLGDEDGSDWGALSGGDSCSPDTHFARIMNAAVMIDQVYYSLMATTLGQDGYAYDWLGRHLSPRSDRGYVADCNNLGTVATHYGDEDTPTRLYYNFFWTYSAPERASTLIHEAVHDWIGHTTGCPNCGASCDTSYGESNAQTWQIVFLDNTLQAYRREEAPGSTELAVAYLGDYLGNGVEVCGYIPRLSPESRLAVIGTMNWKINDCFVDSPTQGLPITKDYTGAAIGSYWEYGGIEYNIDRLVGARWDCLKICDVATVSQECNEDYQDGNQAINQYNTDLCNEVTAELHAGLTPSERTALTHEYNQRKKNCIPGYSEAYLTSYCTAIKNAAHNVEHIQTNWYLEDQPGLVDSYGLMQQCIRSFCRTRFNQGWVQDSREVCYEFSDSQYGCADSLCGSLPSVATDYGNTSQEYFMAIQCRRHFFENYGEIDEYFTEQNQSQHCDRVYINCINQTNYQAWKADKEQNECHLVDAGARTNEGTYALGALNSIPSTSNYQQWRSLNYGVEMSPCMATYQLCNAMEDMAYLSASELIAISNLPYEISKVKDLPDLPPFERFNVVEQNVRQLITIAISTKDENPYFTPIQAIRALRNLPVANQAFSRLLGRQMYFAVFGAGNARADVFGSQLLSQYQSAQIPVNNEETDQQKAIRITLQSHVETRLLYNSSLALTIYENAALNNPGALYTFLKSVMTAESLEDINLAMDSLVGSL